MNIEDAKKVVEAVWADSDGVTLVKEKEVHRVVHKDGTILGAGFSWDAALKLAARPVLEAAARAKIAARQSAEAELMDFMIFLKEKHLAEFKEWRAARYPGGEPGRDEPDQKRLVQLVQS